MSTKQYWPSEHNRFLVVYQPPGTLGRTQEQQWAFSNLNSARAKATEVGGSVWKAFGKGWLPLNHKAN